MVTKSTANAFNELIDRSGLIKPDKLEGLIAELQEAGVDCSSPKEIAKGLIEKEALTRWQAEFLLKGKHKGFFVGPYRLLRLLGKGGMGTVYLAEHEMMRRRCALKVLPSRKIRSDTSMLERFYLEAQAVASLDHRNIVRAYDVNKETQGKTEIHYLVMEFVDGEDIQTLVDRQSNGIEFVEAAEYARQAALGLAHAHDNGLIHRDIKPANLLVDTKGVVKILDLGLARFFDDDEDQDEKASLTAEYNETTLGTADYLSPEQALNPHDVDVRTDIYSLGCTLYFMLTDSPPFPNGTVAQRLLAHQVKSPTPVAKFRPDVPDDLVAIVDLMIAKKPSDRFQTATTVADTIADWLAEFADEEWKADHPDVVGDRQVASRASREPTRAIGVATEDTELGFAPSDDDEKEPAVVTPGSQEPAPTESVENAFEEEALESNVGTELEPWGAELPPLDDLHGGGALGGMDLRALDNVIPNATQVAPGGIGQPARIQSGIHPGPGHAFGGQAMAPSQHLAAERHKKRKRNLLWTLIGVGAGVPLILVVLIIANGSSSSEDPKPASPLVSQGPDDVAPSQNTDGQDSPDSQTKDNDTSKDGSQPLDQEPKDGSNQPENTDGGKEPPKDNDKPDNVVVPPVQVEPPPKSGDDSQKPVSPPTDRTAKPDKPPPPSEENLRQLFANVKEISFKLDNSIKKQDPLAATIKRVAGDTCLDAGLSPQVGEAAPALLDVKLSSTVSGKFTVLTLAGELKCDVRSGKVTVWKHEYEIGKVLTILLKGQLPSQNLRLLRFKVLRFFGQFKRDYKAAVAEFDSK